MDVRLFLAVLWRFKRIVIGGFFLAVILAVLAYGTPTISNGQPTIAPRGGESWQSQAELLITQASFPYGRAVLQYTPGSPKTNTPSVPVGDQQYMSSLAPVYAALANGDAVQGLIYRAAPHVVGSVSATQVSNAATSQSLPFIDLTSTAPTSANAAKLAATAATVLSNYVTTQQTAAGIPTTQRIQLQLVQNGRSPQLVSGHKPTVPLLVFVAVFGAAIALAFILESMYPKTAARLGIVPGGSGQGAFPPSATPSLDRGPAVVRLDHLLAGVHSPHRQLDEPHDPDDPGVNPHGRDDPGPSGHHRAGDPGLQSPNRYAEDRPAVNGEDQVAPNGGASATRQMHQDPNGTEWAAKSLWETAHEYWTASQAERRQGVPFRSDSDR